jgi:hypothetical protein
VGGLIGKELWRGGETGAKAKCALEKAAAIATVIGHGAEFPAV